MIDFLTPIGYTMSMKKCHIKIENPKDYTPSERRVLLAKDVLAHLKAKRIKPTDGLFMRMFVDEATSETYSLDNKIQLHKLLNKGVEPCEVCADGALIYAAAMRFNKMTDRDVDMNLYDNEISADPEPFMNMLKKWFGEKQSALIDIAFEAGKGAYTWRGDINNYGKQRVKGLTEEEFRQAVRFYNDNYDFGISTDKVSEKILVAIMKNIILNNGTFKP